MFRLATSSAKTQLNIGTTMKVKVKKKFGIFHTLP